MDKYSVDAEYARYSLVFMTLFTHLDNFGNIIYSMITSLKKKNGG